MKRFIALAFVTNTLFLAGCCTTPHDTKWVYKQIPPTCDYLTLNALLDDNWSLVCFGDSPNGDFYLLKHPKQ